MSSHNLPRQAPLLLGLIFLPSLANAAAITSLFNLDVGGISYNVTFHTISGTSFNTLWDADDDGTFGGGSSIFSSPPTFWNDATGAKLAAEAIVDELGTTDGWNASSDGVLVPCGTTSSCTGSLSAGGDTIFSYVDNWIDYASDTVAASPGSFTDTTDVPTFGYVYASFSPASANSIPLPSSLVLLALGISALGFRRHGNQ